MLSVVMLSVVMLSLVMLNVMRGSMVVEHSPHLPKVKDLSPFISIKM